MAQDDARDDARDDGGAAAGPLAGIRVIEIGQALAGPLAGVVLADMGAEVVKIERPEGGDDARMWGPPFIDGSSVFFHAMNRNKRSVTLDIKQAADVARLTAMVRDADILIQNLRPGVVDAMGIGPEAMCAANPRLIYCSIWAFGYQGPLRMAPGFDPLLQAFGAMMSLTGRPDDPPTFAGSAINDKATGMWCVIGALAALQQRAHTGRGCVIDTSLFESAVAWVETPLNAFAVTGRPPVRTGTASGNLTPYQTFETADDPICIAVGNDRLFRRFAEVLGEPGWHADARFTRGPDRAANRTVLIALIEPVLRTRPRDEWLVALAAAGVPAAPVNDIAQLRESEQLHAVDLLRRLPGSGLEIVGLPISFDKARPHPRTGAPRLGEHNEMPGAGLMDDAALGVDATNDD